MIWFNKALCVPHCTLLFKEHPSRELIQGNFLLNDRRKGFLFVQRHTLMVRKTGSRLVWKKVVCLISWMCLIRFVSIETASKPVRNGEMKPNEVSKPHSKSETAGELPMVIHYSWIGFTESQTISVKRFSSQWLLPIRYYRQSATISDLQC